MKRSQTGKIILFKNFHIFIYINYTYIQSFIYIIKIFDLLHILIIQALMMGSIHFRKNSYAESELSGPILRKVQGGATQAFKVSYSNIQITILEVP